MLETLNFILFNSNVMKYEANNFNNTRIISLFAKVSENTVLQPLYKHEQLKNMYIKNKLLNIA